jgi:hypothetical protein
VTSWCENLSKPVRDVLQIEGLDPSVKNVISVHHLMEELFFKAAYLGSGSYSANVGKLEPGLYYVTIKQKQQYSIKISKRIEKYRNRFILQKALPNKRCAFFVEEITAFEPALKKSRCL